ncbi:Calreticulin [Bagarius yarrelli]|uniref:Calreticulin n=1 Tax=Bagarius yarrelli TaxID=175774 RepID=A0A556U7X0_BAGYA|nr:Calreticulin [Bagarius yarrelli]
MQRRLTVRLFSAVKLGFGVSSWAIRILPLDGVEDRAFGCLLDCISNVSTYYFNYLYCHVWEGDCHPNHDDATQQVPTGSMWSWLSQDYKSLVTNWYCSIGQCCDSGDCRITNNITGLERDLQLKLHGQHLAQSVVLKAIQGFINNPESNKPLTLSFHGWSGTGKNFVARLVADNLYRDGVKSECVRLFIAPFHFPHARLVDVYKGQLREAIRDMVLRCPQTLFIFDEAEKLHPGLIDAIKPYMDHYDNVDGVSYRRAIFLFLSNIGGAAINDVALDFWHSGQNREDIGGFAQSELMSGHLIDFFVPFLPLEYRHVKLCAQDAFVIRGVEPDETTLDEVAKAMLYVPKEEKLFSAQDAWKSRWLESTHKSDYGKFVLSAGKFYGDAEKDKGLQTSQDAHFYAISSRFEDFSNKDQPLVLQFTVKHEQSIDCGGGYIKLFPSGLKQEEMHGDSTYNIMFGPDICGPGTKKVHVIFNYKGKNHLINKDVRCKDDEYTHLYTLIVNPDNTYEVKIDNKKVESGSLEDDWDFLPAKKIKDPEAKKPQDWDEREKIDDPADKKPERFFLYLFLRTLTDWDKPETIPDPDAKKPDDWDEEMDGEWEPPMVTNPEYKGEWKPKQIDNPAYKGKWVHPEIDNPEYTPDSELYKYSSIGVIGLDLWQVKSGTIFDNFLITNDPTFAEEVGNETWGATKVDPSGSGKVAATDAALFLKRSGLSDLVLGKIWDLADSERKGFLNKQQFFVAIRLVACAQNGLEVAHKRTALSDAVCPKSQHVHYKVHDTTSPLLPAGMPIDGPWMVKPEEKVKFDSIFDSLLPVGGMLTGDKVKPVLLNSKLPVDVLGRVWELSDIDRDGMLDKDEFAVWVVSPGDKAKYDELFAKTDSDMDGLVSGPEVRDIFLKTGLPSATLARIWELCDIGDIGKLTREQFALALYLINQKLSKGH